MNRLFGTDGIRGRANEEPMTPETVFELGRAAGYVFRQYDDDTVLVGRDGRLSGDMIECALTAGLCSVGISVCRAGVTPTPAISYLTGMLSASLGIMISASHNPVGDNGIKFFSADGTKIDDEVEREIERAFVDRSHQGLRPTGAAVGRVVERSNVLARYLAHVRQTVAAQLNLAGLTIVVDCANGAMSGLTPRLLTDLGAEVVAINSTPDGLNINEACGSTHPQALQQAVATHLADLGVAHDGDGDRAIFVDEQGQMLDGDHVLAICGPHLHRQGRLPGDCLVTTVLGNQGLDLTLEPLGLQVLRSPVGDRFVWEKMKEVGATLGGEQAGHIIFGEFAHTGDGLITTLQLLDAMLTAGRPLSELGATLIRLPQTTRNLRITAKPDLAEIPAVQEAQAAIEGELAGRGRLVLRYSGTEPLVRVMIEGEDPLRIEILADQMAEVLRKVLPVE
jgi:phosphoglucosamine mutase